MKPFETYPEDRQKLLKLAKEILDPQNEDMIGEAAELADLVKAIIEDESKSTVLLADEIEAAAKERADWLVDAVATATQNRKLLRGDPEEDKWLTESIFLNGEKAIMTAMQQTLSASHEKIIRQQKRVQEMLDRMERASMAYERLGKMTRDDDKTRKIRKETMIELTQARHAITRAIMGAF